MRTRANPMSTLTSTDKWSLKLHVHVCHHVFVSWSVTYYIVRFSSRCYRDKSQKEICTRRKNQNDTCQWRHIFSFSTSTKSTVWVISLSEWDLVIFRSISYISEHRFGKSQLSDYNIFLDLSISIIYFVKRFREIKFNTQSRHIAKRTSIIPKKYLVIHRFSRKKIDHKCIIKFISIMQFIWLSVCLSSYAIQSNENIMTFEERRHMSSCINDYEYWRIIII